MSFNSSLLPYTPNVDQNFHTAFDNSYSNIYPLRYNLIGAFSEPLGCGNTLCNGGCNVCAGVSGATVFVETNNTTTRQKKSASNNPTDDILNSVKGGAKQMPQKKKAFPTQAQSQAQAQAQGEYNFYTSGNTVGQDEQVIDEQQNDNPYTRKLHNMRRIPKFAEPTPGVFVGTDINDSLLPDDTILAVDTECNIYGRPEASLVRKRIDQLNGFGETINTYNYLPPNVPGSVGRPFIPYNFYVTYGPGNQQAWSNRVYQFSTLPTGYTGPTGPDGNPIDKETQGLCLWVNGMARRTIYLIRGPQPYTFHFPLQKDNCQLPCGVDVCSLDRDGGFYFSEDPVGGNASNFINNIGNFPQTYGSNGAGFQPRPFRDTTFVRPGGFCSILVDNSWPDTLFLQSLAAPFQGTQVIILGNYLR